MNPIIPHFCQYTWSHYVLPVLRKSTNVGRPLEEHLTSFGWPTVQADEIDRVKTIQFEYLQEAKHSFRLALDKAKSGGKKKPNKKGKGAEPEPEKPIENCAVFVGLDYPEFQKKTLQIMQKYECNAGELVGDYMKEVRETIKGKEGGIACKFAAYVAEQVRLVGKQEAMQLNLSWSEVELLEQTKAFVFENMPGINNISIMLNNDSKAD